MEPEISIRYLINRWIDNLESPTLKQVLTHRFGIALAVLCTIAANCHADLPTPRLDVINPVGTSAGAEIELTIVGADLDGGETLIFDHVGFHAEFVEENLFKVAVAADVPAGTYDVRVSGRFGISNPRLFAVCRDLTEVAEVEPNNSLAEAQQVPINSAISNHRDGNFHDFYKVSLIAGQRLVADLQEPGHQLPYSQLV